MSSSSKSSSVSECEGSDGEQARLEEAVRGVSLHSQPNLRKSRGERPPSKRHQRDNAGSVEQGGVVSKEVQTFLAHKLAEFLDSEYDVATTFSSDVLPHSDPMAEGVVRLLHSSQHPISLSTPSPVTPHHHKQPMMEDSSSSSDSEGEMCRLREAAVNPTTILRGQNT